MRFENKVALITGAGRGIGAATARLMVKEGARSLTRELRLDRRREEPNRQPRHQRDKDTKNWKYWSYVGFASPLIRG